MDIIRIVKRIEWLTSCRWWILAALLIISAIIPALAVAEIFLIAVLYWVTRHAQPEADTAPSDGGAA